MGVIKQRCVIARQGQIDIGISNREESLVEFICWGIGYTRVYYESTTKSIIVKSAGLLHILEKNLEKLPNTKKFLDTHLEGIQAFQLRRSKKIIDQKLVQEEPLRLWEIQRMAGIRSSYAIGRIIMNNSEEYSLIEIEREEMSLSRLLLYSMQNVNWMSVYLRILLGLVNKSGTCDSQGLKRLERNLFLNRELIAN